MHVVVMGCGRVGSAIARRLEEVGHSVAVIDQDPAAFRRLGPEFGGRQVTGLGFDRQTLLDAGIDSAGAFAAVSSGDNSNIISARVARETFGVQHVVARIYDSKRAEVYERMGIPSVATVPWTVNRLLRELLSVKVSELWREPTGKVLLMRITVTEGWIGRKLAELEAATGARAAWLVRFGEAQLPTAGTVLQDGDQLTVAVSSSASFLPTQRSVTVIRMSRTVPVGSRHSSLTLTESSSRSSRFTVHGTVATLGMPMRS